MMAFGKWKPKFVLGLGLLLLVGLTIGTVLAQRRFSRYQMHVDRNGVPTWEVDADMPEELFTFVRLRYNYCPDFGRIDAGQKALPGNIFADNFAPFTAFSPPLAAMD